MCNIHIIQIQFINKKYVLILSIKDYHNLCKYLPIYVNVNKPYSITL